MRGLPGTTFSFLMSTFLILAKPLDESVSPEMSGTMWERSRILPSVSTMPGFSRPAGP
jgi:hypothetical protein